VQKSRLPAKNEKEGKMRGIIVCAVTLLILGSTGAALAGPGESDLMMELKSLVERQQKQLDEQASEIARLKEQVAGLTGTQAAVTEKLEAVESQAKAKVSTGNKNAEVQLYGHVNRAVLWADDGDSSKAYFVDNLNSQTRMGIRGKVQATEDFSVGTWIEYAIVSNSSGDVNRLNDHDATSTSLNKRQMDLYLQSGKFGKLSLGHGSTASDSSAEVDLSGTNVAALSTIEYTTGGQLFYDSRTNSISSVRIKDVYTSMDGLSRRDRIRYDTPVFYGLSLGGSWISGDAGDLALLYSRQFSGFKLAGAVAYASPGDIMPAVDDQYDGSLSVLLDCGFNATLAGGIQSMAADNRDDGSFWYAKLGYQVPLFKVGMSNFSIDYGQANDLNMNDDEFSSLGLAFVQNISDWGTELYITYRWHDLDRTGSDFDSINAVMSGARIKF